MCAVLYCHTKNHNHPLVFCMCITNSYHIYKMNGLIIIMVFSPSNYLRTPEISPLNWSLTYPHLIGHVTYHLSTRYRNRIFGNFSHSIRIEFWEVLPLRENLY